jgi:hypothetical protein
MSTRRPPLRTLARPLLAPLVALAACAAPGAPPPPSPADAPAPSPAPAPRPRPPFTLGCIPPDGSALTRLEPLLADAVRTVEAFFGAPFPQPFTVLVHPDRASFDASFPPEWGIARTECWMVATGVATGVQLLSPGAWKAEACEHDPADDRHLRELLAHELVHVYHGQRNPSPDFVDVSGLDWFVEGLATLAAGQLTDERLEAARAALAAGRGPDGLDGAWSGPHRYGFSGSLVALLDRELGRERLIELLPATSRDELLALAGTTEAELLESWRATLLAGEPR